jgi:hypothetical protein
MHNEIFIKKLFKNVYNYMPANFGIIDESQLGCGFSASLMHFLSFRAQLTLLKFSIFHGNSHMFLPHLSFLMQCTKIKSDIN